jgi:hypothetical protein
MKALQLSGQRFGRLLVLRRDGSLRGESTWLCRCDCNKEVIACAKVLAAGYKRSCGCLRKETTRQNHKELCGDRKAEYMAYVNARLRCVNDRHKNWPDYGGRGIKFLFESFEQFYAELGPRPAGKSLDRFPNNDGNYEPGNVRWATGTEQQRNKRTSK